jgi:hypothetical protein
MVLPDSKVKKVLVELQSGPSGKHLGENQTDKIQTVILRTTLKK